MRWCWLCSRASSGTLQEPRSASSSQIQSFDSVRMNPEAVQQDRSHPGPTPIEKPPHRFGLLFIARRQPLDQRSAKKIVSRTRSVRIDSGDMGGSLRRGLNSNDQDGLKPSQQEPTTVRSLILHRQRLFLASNLRTASASSSLLSGCCPISSRAAATQPGFQCGLFSGTEFLICAGPE
jgi:hypothetical protein